MTSLSSKANTLAFNAWCCGRGSGSHARNSAAAFYARQARRVERRFQATLDLDLDLPVGPDEVLDLTGVDLALAAEWLQDDRWLGDDAPLDPEPEAEPCPYEADEAAWAWGTAFDPTEIQWGFSVRTRA